MRLHPGHAVNLRGAGLRCLPGEVVELCRDTLVAASAQDLFRFRVEVLGRCADDLLDNRLELLFAPLTADSAKPRGNVRPDLFLSLLAQRSPTLTILHVPCLDHLAKRGD